MKKAKSLESLSPREQKILGMRFGLGYGKKHTFEAIGIEFGTTGQRIRRLAIKALQKISK